MISAYIRQMRHYYRRPYKVYPIDKTPERFHEYPNQSQKGKRDFIRKHANSKNFPEENFKSKGHLLSIWV